MNPKLNLTFGAVVLSSLVAVAAMASPGAAWAQAATAAPAVAMPSFNPKDPYEGFNRRVFGFNTLVDDTVMKPVATAYMKVVPEPARRTVGNFFGNFSDAWSTVNHFLQGKVKTGFEMFTRVGINTVFGLGGLLDIASEAGLDRQEEDLGQTLGRWGVPPGPYLVLPLLGPSTLRDASTLPVELSVGPSLAIQDSGANAGLSLVRLVDTRARLLNASRLLDDVALDKYQFLRDAYLARRRSQVYDGDPPEEPDEDAPKAKPVSAAPPVEVLGAAVAATDALAPTAMPAREARVSGRWTSATAGVDRLSVDQVGGP